MAELKDKVQNVLDEARMLILGSQVLLGFEYRSVFEHGFESRPVSTRFIKLTALSLMLLVFGLLLAPGAYHQVAEMGEDTDKLHRYATKVMEIALLPFALALALVSILALENSAGGLP